MFNLFGNSRKTLVYTNEHIQKDINKFISIFNVELKRLENTHNELIKPIVELVDKINKDYIYIVSSKADRNFLNDLNEQLDISQKKEQISNTEDFIIKIEKNIVEHILKKYSEVARILTEILSDSYFKYIEFKRLQINKFIEKEESDINFPYFGSIYHIKSLHTNITLNKDLNFTEINKKISREKDVNQLVGMESML